MSEFSLYGGPSLQTAKADPGVAARAANGDQGQVLGASVQKAEEAVQGSAEAFARISDFGEMQRQEVELRRIRDESDAKFSRMLAFAPGTKESVFEKDGSIRQGKLKDLAYEFGQKIDALGGSFFHPESAMKAEAVRASVRSSLQERYWGLAAKHQLGVARQAFDTSLKLAEEKQDWGGYERSVDDAVASGTISRDEGELRLLRGRKKASRHHFENLAATNPDLAAEMINRGELDGYFSAAEQDEMMRSLRRRDDSRLTELIEQIASRPKSKNDKQAVTNALLSGPLYQEELGFHAVYERDGDYSACAPQIDSFIYRVADMVRAGEEGADLASKKENVIRLCKRYGKSSEFQKDILNRMDKWAGRKADVPMLKVSDRFKEMEGMKLYRQKDYDNLVGTLGQEAVDAYLQYYQASSNSGLEVEEQDKWTAKYKGNKLEDIEKNLVANTERVVRERFEAWFEGYKNSHNDKDPSSAIQEDMLEAILRNVTGRTDLMTVKYGNTLDEERQKTLNKWNEDDIRRFGAGPKLLSEREKRHTPEGNSTKAGYFPCDDFRGYREYERSCRYSSAGEHEAAVWRQRVRTGRPGSLFLFFPPREAPARGGLHQGEFPPDYPVRRQQAADDVFFQDGYECDDFACQSGNEGVFQARISGEPGLEAGCRRVQGAFRQAGGTGAVQPGFL